MTVETSFMSDEQNVVSVSAPTQRRPDFVAEALSPPIRVGLLAFQLFTEALLFLVVGAMGVWPESGLLQVNEFFGVMTIGMWIGTTFVVFLVYGALLGNNRHIDKAERIWWYTLFALAGPISLPAYWFKHVWPARYEPVIDEGKLAPPRERNPALPPYKREENETRVMPRYV
ncbi:MAG TPA: hypothetical protein VFZ61_30915 [Polyangiales bacterium]